MAKKKKHTAGEEVITDEVKITLAVKETPVATTAAPITEKPKLSPAQIKELLKDYSKVTLKARGII